MKGGRALLERIISAIILAAFAFAAIFFGGIYIWALGLLIVAVGTFEFIRQFNKNGHNLPVGPAVLIDIFYVLLPLAKESGPCLIKFGFTGELNVFPLLLAASIVYAIVDYVLFYEKKSITDGVLSVFCGFYTSFVFSFWYFLRGTENGFWCFIIALAGAVASDTFAFFVGSAIGKHKLCEKLSPKKSVEGAIGGAAGSLVVTLIIGIVLHCCGILTEIPIAIYAVLGIVFSALAQIGDLFESGMKRSLGIKDFGNIIPGHGGALDRVDSYGMPLIFMYYFAVFFIK